MLQHTSYICISYECRMSPVFNNSGQSSCFEIRACTVTDPLPFKNHTHPIFIRILKSRTLLVYDG